MPGDAPPGAGSENNTRWRPQLCELLLFALFGSTPASRQDLGERAESPTPE